MNYPIFHVLEVAFHTLYMETQNGSDWERKSLKETDTKFPYAPS